MASSSKPLLQGRRLSEILEEQQEPFLLDVYLSENGYSDRLLRSRPSPTKLLKLRNAIALKRKGGIFKSILNKLAQAKVFLRALNCIELEDGRLCSSDCFYDIGNKIYVSKFTRLRSSQDDPELSPSSVLDLHNNTSEEEILSSPSTSSFNSAEVSWLFEQLLEYYQSPASKSTRSKSHLDLSKDPTMDSENSKKIVEQKINSWVKQRGNSCSITHLTDLEITRTRKEWSDFKYEMREVGDEIEASIFEDIRAELVSDIIHST